METLLDPLDKWARLQPEKRLFAFLDIEGSERESYCYEAFRDRTLQVASGLAREGGLKNGDRALLVYPPGLESIVAFFACLRLGVIPVPVYAPTPLNFRPGLEKLNMIARDCLPSVALTSTGYLQSTKELWDEAGNSEFPANLRWFPTNTLRDPQQASIATTPNPILFLQYTSGSTGDPKGVIVTHQNVLHNCRGVLDHPPVGVAWLPQYHDMGLIGNYLFTAIMGGTAYGMSPTDFLRRPGLWLRTISEKRATAVPAPNFAYEYCCNEDKLPQKDLQGLDLSSLRLLMNGAEPVRADTVRRFRERFIPFGLPREAFVVAYGLAENTLSVTLHGKRIVAVNKRHLQEGRLRIEKSTPHNNNQVDLVSCGKPIVGVGLRVVDPETGKPLGENQIGEVWVAGKSKCAGYWQKPDISRETFEARLAADKESYLRTGDLGFVNEEELFICGRAKDMIALRGVKYYPQDIEAIVEATFPDAVGAGLGRVAAFGVAENGQERLVLVIEIRRRDRMPDPAAIVRSVRSRYFVDPDRIDFVGPHSIAKTTSGKLARDKTRALWLRGKLPILSSYAHPRAALPSTDGLHKMFQQICELYNLQGDEELTLSEIGIDSLTMVEVILGIQRFLEQHGQADLGRNVDARFLQRLKISELSALANAFAPLAAGAALPISPAILESLQADQDRAERERMQADARIVPAEPIPTRTWKPPENVLLTGASGFFGRFLLHALLQRTSCRVFALLRATDAGHGMQRLELALRQAELLTPQIQRALRERVQVVCGDLSCPNLDLPAESWQMLAQRVDAIIHAGAHVNYLFNYDAMQSHNVLGTRELLRLAWTGSPKAFHLISTTFIYGWTTKAILLERDHNEGMESLEFGYAQTKWVAEQLVHEAAKHGLPVRIYRSALLSASKRGIGSNEDIAVRLVTFMINHKMAVDLRNDAAFLPVDVAADNVISIFKLPRTDGDTFHVTADDYHNMLDVTRSISKQFGYTFKTYSVGDFIDEMNRICTKDDLLYPLLTFCNRFYRKIEAMEDKRYDNRAYRQARAASREAHSDPTLDETVSYIVKHMIRNNLIPPPPKTSH